MKNIIYIAGLFLFTMVLVSCQSETTESADTTPVEEVSPKINQQPNTPPPDFKTKNPDPIQSRINRAKARPKSQMVADFPFDIDLKTADGEILKSNELLDNGNKPTVVLFWLTTCFPCKVEMTNIAKVYPEWEKETGVKLIAISTDFERNYGKFSKMVKEKNWPWEAYNDTNREFRRVMPGGLNGLPQTFLFDKDGNIVYHKRKYRNGDEFILYEEIKKLVGKA